MIVEERFGPDETDVVLGIGDLARALRALLERGHEPEWLMDRCRNLIEVQHGDIEWHRRQAELRRRVAACGSEAKPPGRGGAAKTWHD